MQLAELRPKERDPIFSDIKQIYIVDDEESVCRSMKILLMTCGFKVKTFSSAEEFFSAIPNSAPGCLILDVYMPGLVGWEAQQRLIKSGSKRPVIIVSADKSDGLKDRALRVGAMGFVRKPFNDRELINLLDQAFTNK